MLIYWLLFGFFAIGALVALPHVAAANPQMGTAYPQGSGAAAAMRPPQRHALLAFGALVTIGLIGFRYRVGGDWFSYELIFSEAHRSDLMTVLGHGDPGYQLFNWLAYRAGAEIWLVNLMGGAIFGWGLYRLASVQPAPWLAFATAIPYLVIVVAMGYTRQSIALGVLMAGLARQSRGASSLNFALYVALAATFHRTAAMAFPLVALSSKGSRVVNLLLTVSMGYLLYDAFLGGDEMSGFVHNYVDTEYSSQGALIRISMNMVAAVLLWVFRRRLGFEEHEYKIWRNFAVASFAFLLLLTVIPSTAVDRMALYLLPLQIAVLTRVALIGENRLASTIGVLLYFTFVQFVWLNFAVHARLWLPYQFYPL